MISCFSMSLNFINRLIFHFISSFKLPFPFFGGFNRIDFYNDKYLPNLYFLHSLQDEKLIYHSLPPSIESLNIRWFGWEKIKREEINDYLPRHTIYHAAIFLMCTSLSPSFLTPLSYFDLLGRFISILQVQQQRSILAKYLHIIINLKFYLLFLPLIFRRAHLDSTNN